MTDIAIRIKSTYDGAGTASARKDVDALAKAAQGAGGAKPSTAGYDLPKSRKPPDLPNILRKRRRARHKRARRRVLRKTGRK